MKQGVTTGSLVFIFVLGVMLLNAPLLSIVNLPGYVVGIPILYLYLFAVWAFVILLMALTFGGVTRAADLQEQDPESAVEDRSD